ncbi:MAG: hypothetical protein ACXVW3_12835 [Nocardioidaceae bacterium]
MRTLAHRLATVTAGVLAVSGLAGCAGQTESYCSTIRDDKPTLEQMSSMSGKGRDAFDQSLSTFKDLRDKAPHDVAGDWATFVSAWQGLVDAFDATSAPPSAFRGGHRPPGVGEGQFQAVREAVQELQSTRVLVAAQGIEQHAADVCHVELGTSGL